ITHAHSPWSTLYPYTTLFRSLLDGPRRFGDLQQAVPGIAPNVLTQRLRHLEREALAVARPYSRRPPRFTYELTESTFGAIPGTRSEEHTSELQSRRDLVCRLL